MRSILVILIVFASLPYIVMRPYIGVLVWSWLSYMNPHRLTWGLAYNFPFAQLVGATTLIGVLYNRDVQKIPITLPTILLALFTLWTALSTLFAVFPDYALEQFSRFIKIQVMTFVTLLLITDRKKLEALIWTIALSLGFYGVKGGIFTITTKGNYLVWGPPGSFIHGNNELAFALLVTAPLMMYLFLQAKKKLLKWAFGAMTVLTIIAVLGSRSRGALLALGAMTFMLLLQTRNKLVIGAAVLAAAGGGIYMMPEEWFGRMETIKTYEEDRSAMGRLNVWLFAYKFAQDHPILGGGFDVFDRSLYMQYIPDIASDPTTYVAADAHSIYFEVLAEQGFVGLALFLALLWSSYVYAGRIRKRLKGDPENIWLYDLGSMLRVSIVTYAVGGAFLGLAYFDLYYHIVALIILAYTLMQRLEADGKINTREKETRTPHWRARSEAGHA